MACYRDSFTFSRAIITALMHKFPYQAILASLLAILKVGRVLTDEVSCNAIYRRTEDKPYNSYSGNLK
jgi:hypothetical protein